MAVVVGEYWWLVTVGFIQSRQCRPANCKSRPIKPYLQRISVCKLIRENFWISDNFGIVLPIKQTPRKGRVFLRADLRDVVGYPSLGGYF
jgi:hypothetical protein